MSEKPANYQEPETTLHKLEHDLKTIQQDPTASYWLKQAIAQLWERDVVDALNDLDTLRELLEEKQRIYTLMLKQMVTSHDGAKH